MTQPIQEPTQGRLDSGFGWRTSQLFRRPAVVPISSLCIPVVDSAYAAAVMADTPQIYWQLQDCGYTSSALDSSGNGYDGSVFGIPTWRSPGPFGVQKSFAGDASVSSGAVGVAPTTPAEACKSLEFWFYMGDDTTDRLIAGWNYTGSGPAYVLLRNESGTPSNNQRLWIYVTLVGPPYIGYVTAQLTLGNWYHIVVAETQTVLTGTTHTVAWEGYTNGSSSGSTALFPAIADVWDPLELHISTFGVIPFSHFAEYSYVLSSGQVAAHYAAA